MEYPGMGQAPIESSTASGKTALNPKEIHMESSEQRCDPCFMGCSSSPPRADVPCPSGSLFPMVKTPTDQRKRLLGAGSAAFQPENTCTAEPLPVVSRSGRARRHDSHLGDAVKRAADKHRPGELISRKM